MEEGKGGIIQTVIQRGRPWEKYRSKIIEAVNDYQLSLTFGWTPQEIDELDYDRKLNYLALLSGKASAKRDK